MRTVTVHLRAINGSPYSPTLGTVKVGRDGRVAIPGVCFQKALRAAADEIRHQRRQGYQLRRDVGRQSLVLGDVATNVEPKDVKVVYFCVSRM